MNLKPIQQSIDPRLIRTDLGTQARNANSDETIREYAEAMENGTRFPPITVFFDVDNELYILADGFHRLFAHLRVKPNDPIIIEQYLGNVEDAQWFSIGANKSHGLKRTNEDKRNAVSLALLHANGMKLSNRQIAEHVGVTHSMLNKVRKEMEVTGRLETVSSRIGKDGRIYDITNIGQKPDEVKICGGCGHYKSPRCLLEGETRSPNTEACDEFIPISLQDSESNDEEPEEESCEDREYVKKEIKRRVSRLKKGEYVAVPLSKTNTDQAAAEIRHYFDDNYLAALAQSAIKLLKN